MIKYEVRGLPLPPLLIALLEQKRWRHPGDELLQSLIPYLREPVDFLLSLEKIDFESDKLSWCDDHKLSQLFHITCGSRFSTPIHLPWLDIEKAFFIAVNRVPGDDIAIALDYRTDVYDPRVVASDLWSIPGRYVWQEVTPTFSQFVARLGLNENVR
jgi:hypothetical protein